MSYEYKPIMTTISVQELDSLRTENAELKGALDEVVGMSKEAWAGMKNMRSRLAAAELVIQAARVLAEEARPHTDFPKLWHARDMVWAAIKEYDARKT